MKNVLDNYEVNQSTMALLPAYHNEYCTIVIEEHRQLFVRKPPTQIVKKSCLDGGSTYDGRRIAVSYRTGAKQKVPIPINPHENIFAFPTHSPKSTECSWIFYHHVKSITLSNTTVNTSTQSIITFKNGQKIILNESFYILEKQMQRTALCILTFTPKLLKS